MGTEKLEYAAKLEGIIADLRDAFPMPNDGRLQALWMDAMSDPESVPAYVKARIAELEKELEEARPKWKVCPSCMGRGKRDVAHGVTAPCKECSGAKVLAVGPQTNRA